MICVVLESRSNPSYEQFLSSQAEQQQQQLGLLGFQTRRWGDFHLLPTFVTPAGRGKR